MKKLRATTIGVDQGKVELFSEFAEGGEMWVGSGTRERRQYIPFSTSYRTPPTVHLSFALWDVDRSANLRADLMTENLGTDGFDMVFRTWADTRIARVHVAWMSIGEVASDDDWDL
ncbi:H-type lectin domain-containing protein [Puniceibacterium sp. IMCC21224]|uniref:H-type lectin domain-containing protein n=1 Tax=Puniceibacterium sp. IMCC21224 TaxID=1618204 RepID=UPI00064DF106|nr:H-type lectin domain-containing protein [Puniceibacterium sp. IMCC21224]KMK66578.1 H-type lectin domain [Puniceibacterium sp. IMCC21224]